MKNLKNLIFTSLIMLGISLLTNVDTRWPTVHFQRYLCMGLYHRAHFAGLEHRIEDVVDEVFEESLLDYLIHQYS